MHSTYLGTDTHKHDKKSQPDTNMHFETHIYTVTYIRLPYVHTHTISNTFSNAHSTKKDNSHAHPNTDTLLLTRHKNPHVHRDTYTTQKHTCAPKDTHVITHAHTHAHLHSHVIVITNLTSIIANVACTIIY